MGLDIYISKPERVTSWSYSYFHAFRRRLAREIGIDLDQMEGFVDPRPEGGLALAVAAQSWDGIKDPIVPFLNHSDCDGEIGEQECEKIGPRLRELVQRWPADDPDRQQAEQLADAMEDVASTGFGKILFR
jgi:hypothetical protein